MTVLYEDNHIIAVNKTCNEIVQGDKTGDTQEHLTGFVVLFLYVRLDGLTQRRVTRLITLHNLVTGLVNRNNMVVFV